MSHVFLRRAGAAIALTLFVFAAGSLSADKTRGADADKLKNVRVAILVTDGFEESEMLEPRKALDAAGAKTTLICPSANPVWSWKDGKWGRRFIVDLALDKALPTDFDALLLP